MRSYSNQNMHAGIQSSRWLTQTTGAKVKPSLYPEIVTSFPCIVSSYQEQGLVFIISRRSSVLARLERKSGGKVVGWVTFVIQRAIPKCQSDRMPTKVRRLDAPPYTLSVRAALRRTRWGCRRLIWECPFCRTSWASTNGAQCNEHR